MSNGDKPAYPVSITEHTGFSPTHEKIYTTNVDGGLTKREMFAMAAMQGLLSGHSEYFHGNGPVMIPEMVAKHAVEYADALLKQLE